MRYAIIQNEKVVDIIEADEVNANAIANSMGATAVLADISCGIGYSCVNDVVSAPAQVPETAELTALKKLLSSKIDALNAKYAQLNLSTDDTLVLTVPKLISAGVPESEVVYLNTLYQAIREAQL